MAVPEISSKLSPKSRNLPKSEIILEERGSNLSGGQRQRIAIARTLAQHPRILILDEATAASDYKAEGQFQENLKRIGSIAAKSGDRFSRWAMRSWRQGRTVLIIAHRLSTVRNADTILVMEEGRLMESGTHKELLDRNGAYAALVKASGLEG